MLRMTVFAALLAFAGCATATLPASGERSIAAEGTAVPLGKAVKVGTFAVEPLRVTEDSRCPINARCVWAGRLVIEVSIAGSAFEETAALTLGKTSGIHGSNITLVEATPAPITGSTIEPADYRFTFEAE